MRNNKALLCFSFFLGACSPGLQQHSIRTVQREPLALPMRLQANIFDDFRWTEPPVESRELSFAEQDGLMVAQFDFQNRTVTLLMDGEGKLAIRGEGETEKFVSAQVSAKDRYYRLGALKIKSVQNQRWLPRYQQVTRHVEDVQKKKVTQVVPVLHTEKIESVSCSGLAYKTNNLQYVTYHTRQYEVPSIHRKDVTTWRADFQWQSIWETGLEIPEYRVYTIEIFPDQFVFVYRIEQNDGTEAFYLQNPSYYWATISSNEPAVKGRDFGIIAIDANSNGIFFEEDDGILFNNWNPYRRDSAYSEIPGLLGNFWYRVKELKSQALLVVDSSTSGDELVLKSANERFAGLGESGRISVTNLFPRASRLYIDGRLMEPDEQGVFSVEIEYGLYQMEIRHPGHAPFLRTIQIDDKTPSFEMRYEPNGRVGALQIENANGPIWKLVLSQGPGKWWFFENETLLHLPKGRYTVIVSMGGFHLKKEVEIEVDRKYTIDFAKEILGPDTVLSSPNVSTRDKCDLQVARIQVEIEPGFFTNCYVVSDSQSREAVVIDPGAEPDRILRFASERGLEIEGILLTHAHPDHTGGVEELQKATGAPVYVHPSEIANAAHFGQTLTGVKTVEVEEGSTVKAGCATLQCLHTPGHSPGSLVVYSESEKIAFSGDTLFAGAIGRTDLPGGDSQEILRQVERITKTLPNQTLVLPGHGDQTTIGVERAGFSLVRPALR